jgi:hypothetical protein
MKIHEFNEMMAYLLRPRQKFANGGRTGQGFQLGNPGNPQSLKELNISRKQEQDARVKRFKELVRAGNTPNEAKKKVIEEFKLIRNPKAGTPTWMTKGKEELIAEGFDYKASARGPENVGGVEKAAQKRKQVIGEGRKFEERVKRTKQKTGFGKKFELAHTANIFQAKKLGIDYPIDALAIQATEVNQVVAEKLNDELKPKYSKQLKLINKMKRKNTPSLQKQLDKINFEISEIVATGGKQGSKAANVLKPIIVDPITLKGNILNLGFDTSTELMASPGATTKKTIAGSPDDLMARVNVGQQLSANPFFDPKNILTGLGDVARVVSTPTVAATFAGTTIKENLEKGESLPEALADPMVGIELLYPELGRRTVGQLAPRGAGILSTLGRVAANPFGRAARLFTPVGAGLTAVGLAKDAYERYQELEAMSPEERQELARQRDEFSFGEFSGA